MLLEYVYNHLKQFIIYIFLHIHFWPTVGWSIRSDYFFWLIMRHSKHFLYHWSKTHNTNACCWPSHWSTGLRLVANMLLLIARAAINLEIPHVLVKAKHTMGGPWWQAVIVKMCLYYILLNETRNPVIGWFFFFRNDKVSHKSDLLY